MPVSKGPAAAVYIFRPRRSSKPHLRAIQTSSQWSPKLSSVPNSRHGKPRILFLSSINYPTMSTGPLVAVSISSLVTTIIKTTSSLSLDDWCPTSSNHLPARSRMFYHQEIMLLLKWRLTGFRKEAKIMIRCCVGFVVMKEIHASWWGFMWILLLKCVFLRNRRQLSVLSVRRFYVGCRSKCMDTTVFVCWKFILTWFSTFLEGKKWYPSAADIPNIQYVDRVSHFNMPVMTG